MNTLHKSIIAIACAGMSVVHAAEFEDYARVVNVTPLVEQINMPRQECRTESVPVQRQSQGHNVGGAIVGGILGGVVGSQFGKGNGRTAAAAVGAMSGAMIGDRAGGDGETTVTEQPVRQCRTVDHWESRTSGYNVTYEYRGHSYTSVMPYDPGERVRLAVSLTPR